MALSEKKLNAEVDEATIARTRAIEALDIVDLNHDLRVVPINQAWAAAVSRAQDRHELRQRLYKTEVLGRVDITAQGRPIPLNPYPCPPGGFMTTDMNHPWRRRQDDIQSSRMWLERHAAEIAFDPAARPTDRAVTKQVFYMPGGLREQLLTEIAVG
jgi:hypothetical protein